MKHPAPLALMTAALWLMACAPPGLPEAPRQVDLAQDLVRLSEPGPPTGPEGACWESDVIPMVIETVTQTVQVSPEQRGPDGAVAAPAVFRSDTEQTVVRQREEVWFRTPCPGEMTPDLIASLQRALKARGLYQQPVTARVDAPTRAALRRFQAERGLDSDRLSLAAARALGLVPVDLGQP